MTTVLGEYEAHYNTHRPHRALEQLPPIAASAADPAAGNAAVKRTDIWLRGRESKIHHVPSTDVVGRGVPVLAVKVALDEISEASVIVVDEEGGIAVMDRPSGAASDALVLLNVAAVTADLRRRWPWPNRPDPDPVVA